MKILFSALSDVGLVRRNNEDNFLVADLDSCRAFAPPSAEGQVSTLGGGALLAVADGMGGALAGEVASKMAVETLAAACEAIRGAESDTEAARLVREAIERANATIHASARANANQHGMGTTLTAALVRGPRAYLFQVGDSRGYLRRGGVLEQRTTGHSLHDELEREGVITREQAEELQGGRNIITRALGAESDVEVDSAEVELEQGDLILLCSDGLHGCVRHRDLEPVVAAADTPRSLCYRLVDLAKDHGAPDNVTVVAFSVLEGPPPGSAESRRGLGGFLRRLFGRGPS